MRSHIMDPALIVINLFWVLDFSKLNSIFHTFSMVFHSLCHFHCFLLGSVENAWCSGGGTGTGTVLGGGGGWFWDPVENASFMPWLVGTALIHSLAVTEKRGAFKSWTVLLAISAFSLSLLGTFLVRSGILDSIHAFVQEGNTIAWAFTSLICVMIAVTGTFYIAAVMGVLISRLTIQREVEHHQELEEQGQGGSGPGDRF